MKIKVLDHGYVRLVDSMGKDSDIIEAARMSTNRGFNGWNKDAGLLDFLWRHQHTSPFEMGELTFEVQAPLFVIREWQRHRTQSYNEFSARYSQMPDLHYIPKPGRIQRQSATNKQGSAGVMDSVYAKNTIEGIEWTQTLAYSHYLSMLENGVAKEVARINTPVSRYTKMRVKANLLNWFRFLNLRLRPNAQYEIRVFAEAVAKCVKKRFPRAYSRFEEHTLHGVQFSRTEMNALRKLVAKSATTVKKDFENEKRFDEFVKKLTLGGTELL